LNTGLITSSTTFEANGSFEVSGQVWKDWNPEPRGDVSLAQALEESVDVYFYNLGYLFYQQSGTVLQDGVRQFGFGKVTGIDLPGEAQGRVPDKNWKRENGKTEIDQIWKPGDDINLAIGQGDLLVTPLQLAVGLSAIANGGTLWVPRLGLQITDTSGNVIHEFASEKSGELDMSADTLGTIKKALTLVTSDPSGTAYHAFEGFPIRVAGKTGTAQKNPDDDYAWFMGYAPADSDKEPEIVVVALVEQGGHGSSVAAPMVRKVMEAYFHTESSSPYIVPATE
jgi:penicillin-binding protein 2